MKNRIIFLTLLLVLVHFSCNKADERADCVQQFTQDNNLLSYTGQVNVCYGYYSHYKYEGKDYLVYDNSCIDMIPKPFECGEDTLHEDRITEFFLEAEFVKIIGVEP